MFTRGTIVRLVGLGANCFDQLAITPVWGIVCLCRSFARQCGAVLCFMRPDRPVEYRTAMHTPMPPQAACGSWFRPDFGQHTTKFQSVWKQENGLTATACDTRV